MIVTHSNDAPVTIRSTTVAHSLLMHSTLHATQLNAPRNSTANAGTQLKRGSTHSETARARFLTSLFLGGEWRGGSPHTQPQYTINN
ncbi:hypothetical protein JTE90_019860 [Oedothorax gibbosus]|uniref:Uncharacterized protein n=1 Tax=Oedothorax gibbosus TaxID=931172 RepID=A0AAV6W0E5_9ARAC|nr:hypothetical protein JTE90_019860 [Oedothorax gibbosus]